MADIVFEDYHIKVEGAIAEKAIAFLYEAAAKIQAQTARNSRVKTGQTAGSWKTNIDEENLEGLVGSALENAIWEEFGTGEYALNGDGRMGGWAYQDESGNWHYTYGKEPQRPLWNAFEELKPKIEKILYQKLQELNDN